MTTIGYARVSTRDQDPGSQEHALIAAGAVRLFVDHGESSRGVNIKSLTEPDIDTTTPMGRALFGIVAVFTQLRVDTIRDNIRRGLKHACAQGRLSGQPSVMSTKGVAAAVLSETPEPVPARSPGRSALALHRSLERSLGTT